MISEATLEKIITVKRATMVAQTLFPGEISTGNCHNQDGKAPGEPCDICAARTAKWEARVIQVRQAMKDAFR